MTKFILLDSNLWHYAYIIPKEKVFRKIHEKALSFLENVLKDSSLIIVTTHYQIAEIMELFRKSGLESGLREKIFKGFKTPKFEIVSLDLKTLEYCFHKSLSSGIHIYDYLVVFPLRGTVTEIFSADGHLQHKDFKEIAKVTNPLHPWILKEGKLPYKKSAKFRGLP